MKTHYFTLGDIGSRLASILRDPDGSPMDVTGDTVTARLCAPDRTISTITMTLTGTGADGAVHHDWTTGELDQVGRWQIEYRINGNQSVYEVEMMHVRQAVQGV